MKQIIWIAIFLIAMSGVSAAETIVDVTWDGSGDFETNFVAGDDATSDFNTGGNHIWGNYKATDSDDNPYGYNVDTINVQVEANFDDGGYMEFENIRTDSQVSMYGEAGERSYSYIESTDTGSMDFRTSMNYAAMTTSNYGWNSNDHFQAEGVYFDVYHSLYDDTGEGAWIWNEGSGSTEITLMSESTWGKTGSFKFGKGSGCYTNAKVESTGAGYFEVGAVAENQIDADVLPFSIYGDGTLGSSRYTLQVNYGAGFNFDNFALSGN